MQAQLSIVVDSVVHYNMCIKYVYFYSSRQVWQEIITNLRVEVLCKCMPAQQSIVYTMPTY